MLFLPRSRSVNARRSGVRPWIARARQCGIVVVRQVAQARRAVGEGGWEGATARRRLPVLRIVSLIPYEVPGQHAIETARRTNDGLDDAQDALQPLPDICVLRLDRLFLAEDDLQVMVRLLTLQVPDALIEAIDLVLGALSNGTLSFAVVCALAGKLFRREIGHATRIGASPALFVGLTIARAIISRGPFGCICLRRRRHADHGCVGCDSGGEWAAPVAGFSRVMSWDTTAAMTFASCRLELMGHSTG